MFYSISKKITAKMVIDGIIPSAEEELYTYGFHQGFILLINIVSSLILGLLMGRIFESILLLTVYIPLRTYAGGYHAKSPLICYFFSLIVIFFQLLCLSYIDWSQLTLIILTLLSGIVIFIMVPVEAINKKLSDKEKIVYASKARKILLLEITIVLCTSVIGLKTMPTCILESLITLVILLAIGKGLSRDTISHTKK